MLDADELAPPEERSSSWSPSDPPRRPPAVIGGVLLGVDVGGTFTDAVLARRRSDPHGEGADDARRPVARA